MPIIHHDSTGQSLYARFDDGSNTAVDLTEGSSLNVGKYTAADSAIVTAGLAAGTYTGRIFGGTAGAQANTDYQVGSFSGFVFNGTNEVADTPQTGDSYALAAGADGFAATKAAVDATKAVTDALSPRLPGSGTLATGADVAAVSLTAISPDRVSAKRTWLGNEYRAQNIVEVGDNFAGVLSLQPDINPNSAILTVDSVSITGAASVTATDLSTTADRKRANFTVPALTTTGTYTVVVTVTTTDGDTIPTTGTLKVN